MEIRTTIRAFQHMSPVVQEWPFQLIHLPDHMAKAHVAYGRGPTAVRTVVSCSLRLGSSSSIKC